MVTTIHPLSLALPEPEPEEWAGPRARSVVVRTPRVRTPSVTASSAPPRTPPAPPCPLQWATPSVSSQRSILVSRQLWIYFSQVLMFFYSQLPRSLLLRLSTRLCRQVTPISTAEWAACPASSTEGAWPGAESTLASTRASRCPQLPDPRPPASSRTRRPMETGNRARIARKTQCITNFSLVTEQVTTVSVRVLARVALDT